MDQEIARRGRSLFAPAAVTIVASQRRETTMRRLATIWEHVAHGMALSIAAMVGAAALRKRLASKHGA
jgi:hypothetical protein